MLGRGVSETGGLVLQEKTLKKQRKNKTPIIPGKRTGTKYEPDNSRKNTFGV
jgi:hypothetical protein